MTEQKKKRNWTGKREWISILLLLSCIASVILYWDTDYISDQTLQSTAQIDSLIIQTFTKHGVQPEQIREREITIDSTFTRKVYTVAVPSGFSKTSLHYNLHSELLPYAVRTAGKVQFPEYNVSIHVLYDHTVLRTISLQTDPLLNAPQ